MPAKKKTVPTFRFLDHVTIPTYADAEVKGHDVSEDDLQAFLVECVDVALTEVGHPVKRTAYADGGVKWEIKSYECYLAVYVRDGRVTYTVRVNTVNYQDTRRYVWFDPDQMSWFADSLAIRCIGDLHELAWLCANMSYAPEYNFDMLPRQSYGQGGYTFYGEKEALVLSPRSYMAGWIDYDVQPRCDENGILSEDARLPLDLTIPDDSE